MECEGKMSQTEAILGHLKRGHMLTAHNALRLFGTLRLAARIAELRARGHDVLSEPIKLPSGKRVAGYWLND
jgi:hypothetical protein